MAKTSMVNRDIKRKKLAEKFAVKRAALKKIVSSPDASYEEKIEAATKLSKLPRDSSPSRHRNRCELSGRPRGVYSKLAWVATSCVKPPCVATFRACARPAGNPSRSCQRGLPPGSFAAGEGRRSAFPLQKTEEPDASRALLAYTPASALRNA